VRGAKDRRPALDQVLADARRRRFDVLVCWRLDRRGRNLKHLITLLDDLQALGIAFVSLAEGIDATTPAGKPQMHILGAIAEFEKERIRERVLAGLQRARTQGKRLGRPQAAIPVERLRRVDGLTVDVAVPCGLASPGRRSSVGGGRFNNPSRRSLTFAPDWRCFPGVSPGSIKQMIFEPVEHPDHRFLAAGPPHGPSKYGLRVSPRER
jgi:hypothetical protein